MDGQRASGLDVRISTRSDNPNVFDDEYAVDTPTSDSEFHISDGFGGPSAARSTDSRAQQSKAQSSQAVAYPTDVKTPPAPVRNSIAKNPGIMGGFSSFNDRSGTPVSGHSPPAADGIATPLADLNPRSSSRASSYAPTDRASSPQQSGPSFPYGLYQQSSTGMGRTNSVVTTSTSQIAGARQSILPSGPTHPYGLYRQNGLEEGDGPSNSGVQAIPVGFPGSSNGFHRQIGPDGEEQDIIGPDGHTEQLPPYSRYPEEGSAKVAVPNGSAAQSLASGPQSPQQPSASASTAAILDPSRGESGHADERAWNEKSWRERRRVKMCGGRIPCWMVGVMVGCAIIIAGLVAGLVGGLISANKKDQLVFPTLLIFDKTNSSQQTTTRSDVVIL